jgi:hypothetical protein
LSTEILRDDNTDPGKVTLTMLARTNAAREKVANVLDAWPEGKLAIGLKG